MTRPEDYWIGLGTDIIGVDVLDNLDAARQAPTYQLITDMICERGIQIVLDVGCNLTQLAHYLYHAGYGGHYLGVDSNPIAINHAAFSAQVGNLRSLPFGNASYECVVVKDVIEHLPSFDMLAEAFRVCKRWLILAMYIPWHEGETIVHQHEDGYYINTYDRRAAIRFGRACNFVLLEEKTIAESNGMPNLITLWERIA